MTAAPALRVTELHKSFETEAHRVDVLRGASFDMARGEALAITGPSGSGKSTLLHVIGTLEPPTSGSVEIDGRRPHELPEPELARFRNGAVGFVFQEHHLLPQYSVLENVLVPTLASRERGQGSEERARELLRRVGLSHRLEHRPAELSGGERQRVAVARALINRPSLLLCDEPTGSLDRASADAVAALLFGLHGEEGTVLIAVTHSQALAERFQRRMELREGRCCEL
jgi:lipoprotein-releasing system ATP-binding protein